MSETSVNQRKVAMIGCGFVGSATAFALMESGLFSEMVLIDADKNRAEGEALDISHGLPFARPMKIYAGDYDDIVDAAIIIVTAGANQKPDETRLDLVQKNVGIFKSIIPEIAKRNCGGILLIVSNPVDILTYTALKLSGFPENRVLGSGTVLDTARLKYNLGEPLNVDWDGNELLLSDILGTDDDVISQRLENEVEIKLLGKAISKLSPREQTIIKLRFGLGRQEGREKTQKEVADLLGISQSYISRLEKRIMKRLKKEIVKYE